MDTVRNATEDFTVAVMALICTHDVSGLTLDRNTDCPAVFVDGLSSFRASAGIVALSAPRLQSSKSLPVNYLL
jgi:hypothetical protein